VFGRLLIESPSLYVANRRILEQCRRFANWPLRMYLGIGTREAGSPEKDARVVKDLRALESILRGAGLGAKRLRICVEEGATHSEAAWAARFPQALGFLFPR